MSVCQLERRTERDQEEFECISRQLRKELKQFDRQRCQDFQTSIIVYLESLMNTQQQVPYKTLALGLGLGLELGLGLRVRVMLNFQRCQDFQMSIVVHLESSTSHL